MLRRRVLLPLALLLASCGGSESDSGPKDSACVPGAQKSCACPGGGEGAQICQADGKGYDACFGCGTGGTGGSGGSASGGAGSGGGGASGGSGGTGGKRTGQVKLDGNSLSDDQGRFHALGATLMWAAWGYKNDLPRLEQNLDFLSKHGFHYIRALGIVGDYQNADYWDGREIDWHWSDYDQVISGLTDLAYQKYGLRVEWTLIGDGQKNLPSNAERKSLVDRFVAMSVGREQEIMHFEVANEAWQNGFSGSAGEQELRDLTAYMNGKTTLLVAASAPASADCASTQSLYGGGIADLATVHFDRDVGQKEGHWRPVYQPWWVGDCAGVPVASNNEPIGPGASVSTESEPEKLLAGVLMTYLSGLPLHVFHTGAGVRGDSNVWEMAGADAFGHLAEYAPSDLASWTRKDPLDASAPLRFYAGEGGKLIADTAWTSLGAPENGAIRAYGAVQGKSFIVLPIGILDHVVAEARSGLTLEVVDLTSGNVVSQHKLSAGQQVNVGGAGARLLRGTLD